MRGLSALCLLGIFNAIYWGAKNQWMFEPATKRGGHWWVADAAVGVACVILGPMLWHAAQIRSANRLARTRYRHARGEVSEVELQAAQSDYDKDFS